MILCICNRLTEDQVRAVASCGARCPESAFRTLGCEPQCGTCLDHAREVIDETRANLHAIKGNRAA
jgi:bacterioferritin-associated ferredoxin